jgi:hypothetical protein
MDEERLIGWFANAMGGLECCNARPVSRHKPHCQRPTVAQIDGGNEHHPRNGFPTRSGGLCRVLGTSERDGATALFCMVTSHCTSLEFWRSRRPRLIRSSSAVAKASVLRPVAVDGSEFEESESAAIEIRDRMCWTRGNIGSPPDPSSRPKWTLSNMRLEAQRAGSIERLRD